MSQPAELNIDRVAELSRLALTPEEKTRFSAQLEFEIDDEVFAAMSQMAERISVVSPERVREEFMKLVM